MWGCHLYLSVRLLSTPVAERVKVGMSPVSECDNVFYTYSIRVVGRVKVGMSPVSECENVSYTYSIVGRVKVGMSSPVVECENVFYTYSIAECD